MAGGARPWLRVPDHGQLRYPGPALRWLGKLLASPGARSVDGASPACFEWQATVRRFFEKLAEQEVQDLAGKHLNPWAGCGSLGAPLFTSEA